MADKVNAKLYKLKDLIVKEKENPEGIILG